MDFGSGVHDDGWGSGAFRASDTYAAFKLKKGRWEAVQLRVTCAGVERLTPEGPSLFVQGGVFRLAEAVLDIWGSIEHVATLPRGTMKFQLESHRFEGEKGK